MQAQTTVEIDKQYAQAQKLLKKTVFTKPDPEAAATMFVEAGKKYNIALAFTKACDAYTQAAEASQQASMELVAATSYREAAYCVEKHMATGGTEKTPADACRLFTKSAEMMCIAGKFAEGARSYVQASKHADGKQASEALLEEAMGLFQQEAKPMQACSAMMDLIDSLAESKSDAEQLVRLIAKAKEMYAALKTYDWKVDTLALYGVIVCLAHGDIVGAQEQFNTFVSFRGDAPKLAEDLINAFTNADPDALADAKKNSGAKMSLSNNFITLLNSLSIGEDGQEML